MISSSSKNREASPLLLKPFYVEKPWGNRRLELLLGKQTPAGKKGPVGEAWEVHENAIVLNGAREEETLAERGCRPPFIFKYLDVEQALSVQVHPSPAYVNRHGGFTKDECWYFIEPPREGFIYAGLKTAIPASEMGRLEKEDWLEHLQEIPVKKGDTLLIPSGTIHALTAGTLVAELQEPPQTTYRLFDWDRIDTDGKPRPLQQTEGLKAINPAAKAILSEPVALSERKFRLAAMPRFQMNLLEKGEHSIEAGERAISCLAGSLIITTTEAKEEIHLVQGQTCYFPPETGKSALAVENGSALEFLGR